MPTAPTAAGPASMVAGIPEPRPAADLDDPAGGTASGAVPGDGSDLPELRLVRPLPGFGDLTRFALVRLDLTSDTPDCDDSITDRDDMEEEADEDPASAVLFELRSLQSPDVRFLVAAPAAFFPDYVVDLDEDAVSELGLDRAEDALVLVVLTVGADGESTTANLLAPVVVNARNRSAAQVILSGSDWPVRATVA